MSIPYQKEKDGPFYVLQRIDSVSQVERLAEDSDYEFVAKPPTEVEINEAPIKPKKGK